MSGICQRGLELLEPYGIEVFETLSETSDGDVAEVVEQTVDQLIGELQEQIVPIPDGAITVSATLGRAVEQAATPQSAHERQDGGVSELLPAPRVHRVEGFANRRAVMIPEDVHHLGLQLTEVSRHRIVVLALGDRASIGTGYRRHHKSLQLHVDSYRVG